MNSTPSVPITNATLPLSKLITFYNELFGCHLCHPGVCKQFTIKRYGVATSLYFECTKCKHKIGCHTDLTQDLEAKWITKSPALKFKDANQDRVNGTDFQLNNRLYLVTQQCGGGRMEAKVSAGLLGLHTNALKGRWRDIGNNISLKIIELGKELCAENIFIEMELSPMDDNKMAKKFGLRRLSLG
jgi:hypothetical protein